MIVYNISIKIIPAIEPAWIEWQKKEHIPEIMATGCFTDYNFFRLLEQDETEGVTYVVQYFASDPGNYQRYIDQFASQLRERAIRKWGDQFIAFRTLMEVVH
jgi:hypothetical protein